jgi:hypothetical protein
MMRKPQFYRLFVPVMIFVCSSCSSSGGIDDYFTFNIPKTFTIDLAEGNGNKSIEIPIVLDSADLAKNGTSSSLVKSIELTRLELTPNQSASPANSVIDSLSIKAVDSSETSIKSLAEYFGANDSLFYANSDYSYYFGKGKYKIAVDFHNAPKDLSYTATYILVVTARPKD